MKTHRVVAWSFSHIATIRRHLSVCVCWWPRCDACLCALYILAWRQLFFELGYVVYVGRRSGSCFFSSCRGVDIFVILGSISRACFEKNFSTSTHRQFATKFWPKVKRKPGSQPVLRCTNQAFVVEERVLFLRPRVSGCTNDFGSTPCFGVLWS